MKKIILLFSIFLISIIIADAQSVEILPGNTSSGNIVSNSGTNPGLVMFKNGSSNPLKTIIAHSPSYPNWGLQYQDAQDKFRFSTGTNDIFVVEMGTGNIGVGLNSPNGRMEVNSNSSISNPTLNLSENSTTDGSRLTFSNNNASFFTLYGNPQATAANGVFNMYHSVAGNIMSWKGDGNVGIGESNPVSKLEIAHSYSGISSFDANLNLKATSTFSGINFTNTATPANKMTILGYTNSATASSNYMLFNVLGSNAMIIRGDREIQHYSYTKLGTGAPGIQMKKITGTTNASSTTNVSHGLDWTKILDVSVFINNNTNTVKYPPQENSGSTLEYRMFVNSSSIGLANVSSGLQGNSYEILITYEE